MFGEILKRMVQDDLFVVILLGLWSVVALAIIAERVYVMWDIQEKSLAFKQRVLSAIRKGELQGASALCEASQTPLAAIYGGGLEAHRTNPENVASIVTLRRAEAVQGFKKHLWLLGTVGASAPFVGLFGTVIGVVRSFHSMGKTGQGGFKVVSSGISEALGATALGLLIAIYAVVAYNYFVARVNRLGLSYKVMGEELVLALGSKGKADKPEEKAPEGTGAAAPKEA